MSEKAYLQMIKRLEDKLREYMTEQEYMDLSIQIAKEAFAIEVDDMAESDFKDFCIDKFDLITGDES